MQGYGMDCNFEITAASVKESDDKIRQAGVF